MSCTVGYKKTEPVSYPDIPPCYKLVIATAYDNETLGAYRHVIYYSERSYA